MSGSSYWYMFRPEPKPDIDVWAKTCTKVRFGPLVPEPEPDSDRREVTEV